MISSLHSMYHLLTFNVFSTYSVRDVLHTITLLTSWRVVQKVYNLNFFCTGAIGYSTEQSNLLPGMFLFS